MNITSKTHEIFIELKYALVHMTSSEHLYQTPQNDLLFLYPEKNKMTLHKIVGRNLDFNMPIINFKSPDSEWNVKNDEEIKMALELLTGNI